MMDDEIQETVESLLGKGVKIVDCEKKSSIKEEEVLLVNGCPIELEGEDGAAIREALIHGNIPDCDLLNQILVRAGILKAPVRLETSLSVKSTVSTREEVTVAKGGHVVDERCRETKENNFYSSTTNEIWEPVGMVEQPTTPNQLPKSTHCPRTLFSLPSSSAMPGFVKSDFYEDSFLKNSDATADVTEESSEISSRYVDEVDSAATLVNGLHLIKLNHKSVPEKNGLDHKSTVKLRPRTRSPNIFGNIPFDPSGNQTPPSANPCRRSLPQTTVTPLAGSCSITEATAASLDNSTTEVPPQTSAEYDNALVFRDNCLISGPLEALIQHMVPTTDYYPDRAYVFAFLLSSRLFIKPHELLGQVIGLCDAQQKLGVGASEKQLSSKERLAKFIPRLVQLLAQWSETFPYDFRDERVMAHVRAITHRCVSVEAGVRHQVSSLLTNLLHRLTALEKYEEFLQKVSEDSTANSVEALSSTDVIEMCPNAAQLAEQLTHIELERLSFIGPEEFVQAFAKENPHLESSLKEMKKTRNLEAYVQWFNRLSYLVASHICKHQKKKQRVRAVEYWIETAKECFNIGNFNSLMAIIAGLSMSPISRLKKTWNKIQSAQFSVLEHHMDPSSNFSSYRSTLKAAIWRSARATDLRQRIVIPFFSLLVKDLYFLNEGCSNKLRNGHINFKKFWELAKQVTEFITWKQLACPFDKNSKLITFLQASPVLTENALALASFECEPPENNHEKERYKALKMGGAS